MCVYSCVEFFKRWRLWIRPAVLTLYFVIIVVVLPILVVKAADNGFKKEDQGSIIGGVFVMLAVPISVWGITQHMVHYNKPKLQKHLIRVLWMVPVYAMNAWLGMLFPQWSIYLDSGRECYEAYVIYNFMIYLFNYLNEETNFVETLEYKPQVNHIFPMCCLPTWEMGWDLIHNCKHGILQYTVFRPFTTAVSFICEMTNVYHEGEWRWDGAFLYMMAINNFSQFIAMYCLILFYKANKEELQPMRPVGKFLCIKAVVFFSFFQGFIISLLVSFGVLSSAIGTSNAEDLKGTASRLQNFLICIEMFLAAVAHHFTFSYKPFVNPSAEQKSCCEAFLAMWDVSDVHSDIKEHLEVVGSTLSRRIRGRGMYKSLSEGSRLLRESPSKYSATDVTNGSTSTLASTSTYAESAPPRLASEMSVTLSLGHDSVNDIGVASSTPLHSPSHNRATNRAPAQDDSLIDLSSPEEPKINSLVRQNR